MDLQQLPQIFDAEVREGGNAVIIDPVDVDETPSSGSISMLISWSQSASTPSIAATRAMVQTWVIAAMLTRPERFPAGPASSSREVTRRGG